MDARYDIIMKCGLFEVPGKPGCYRGTIKIEAPIPGKYERDRLATEEYDIGFRGTEALVWKINSESPTGWSCIGKTQVFDRKTKGGKPYRGERILLVDESNPALEKGRKFNLFIWTNEQRSANSPPFTVTLYIVEDANA
jgi:hypothetical protein